MKHQAMLRTTLWQKAGLILLGIFLTAVFLEAGLRLAGFTLTQIQESKNRFALKQQGAYRVLCIGESTTANQYPRFLEASLNKASRGIKFRVIDKGIVGTNTSILVDQLEANLDRYNPQVVVAMMGINDSGEHLPFSLRDFDSRKPLWKTLRMYKLYEMLALHLAAKRKGEAAAVTGGREKFTMPELPKAAEAVKALAPENSPLDSGSPAEQKVIREAETLQEHGDFVGAEKLLSDLVKRNPRNAYALTRLGWVYIAHGKFAPAVIYLSKARRLSPNHHWVFKGLGTAYIIARHYESAKIPLRRGIALSPEDDWSYIELAACYFSQDQYKSAEGFLKNGLKYCDRKDRLHGALALIDLMTGNADHPVDLSPSTYYADQTARNFRTLQRILERRGIHLVCVQYPMRRLSPLKSIFTDNEHVYFVDNEESFKSAVKREGYLKYFTDSFGGDFGHCTEKGNRLLAENIAKVILTKVK